MCSHGFRVSLIARTPRYLSGLAGTALYWCAYSTAVHMPPVYSACDAQLGIPPRCLNTLFNVLPWAIGCTGHGGSHCDRQFNCWAAAVHAALAAYDTILTPVFQCPNLSCNVIIDLLATLTPFA